MYFSVLDSIISLLFFNVIFLFKGFYEFYWKEEQEIVS